MDTSKLPKKFPRPIALKSKRTSPGERLHNTYKASWPRGNELAFGPERSSGAGSNPGGDISFTRYKLNHVPALAAKVLGVERRETYQWKALDTSKKIGYK